MIVIFTYMVTIPRSMPAHQPNLPVVWRLDTGRNGSSALPVEMHFGDRDPALPGHRIQQEDTPAFLDDRRVA